VRLGRERGLESLLETLVRTFSPPRTAWKGYGRQKQLRSQGGGKGRRERYLRVPQTCQKIFTQCVGQWIGLCMIEWSLEMNVERMIE